MQEVKIRKDEQGCEKRKGCFVIMGLIFKDSK
jgi:hypothetical protein